MIGKLARLFLKTLATFVAFVLGYLACAFGFPYIGSEEKNSPSDSIQLFATSNGVHTDIVMPDSNAIMNWNTVLARRDYPGVDSSFHWVSMGWGDKGFYLNTPTWDDLTFSTAIRAMCGLSGTAMHVEFGRKPPFDKVECHPFRVSAAHYQELAGFIIGSFKMDANGKVMLIDAKGYWDNDRFYEAEGRYSLFRTCNSWTNRALAESGHRSGLWAPFQSGVMQQFRP